MDAVDILAFGAHPDDVECATAGTLLQAAYTGKKVVIADLTRGELGTHGSPEQRLQEAAAAAKRLRVTERINLGFEDGNIINDRAHQLKVIEVIRHYRPQLILANAFQDRHPDHYHAAMLVKDAAFLSGLKNISTAHICGRTCVFDSWR